jgi:hypothetical protein
MFDYMIVLRSLLIWALCHLLISSSIVKFIFKSIAYDQIVNCQPFSHTPPKHEKDDDKSSSVNLAMFDTEDDKSSSIDFKMFDIEDFNASDSDDLQYLTPRMISHPLLTLKYLT